MLIVRSLQRSQTLLNQARLRSTVITHRSFKTQKINFKPPKLSESQILSIQTLAHRIGEANLSEKVLTEAMVDQSASLNFNNQRLGLLGQNLVRQYVLEYLFVTYPNLPSHMIGDILESSLLKGKLANIGRTMGLHTTIVTRDRSTKIGGSVVTQGFHALVGALHADLGSARARTFVLETVIPSLANADLSNVIKLQHPKLILSHIMKTNDKPKFHTRLIKETGRGTHLPTFLVGVFSGEEKLGEGAGWSLKEAEKTACATTLSSFFLKELEDAPLPSELDNYLPEDSIRLLRKSSKTKGQGKTPKSDSS